MHNVVVFVNGYTSGNEYKKLTGENYVGTYHILTDGTIKTGAGANSINEETLLPIDYIPVTPVGDLVSEYKEESNDFEGVYSVFPIKNYKNDIDIVLEGPNVGPPTITEQPQLFFKKNVTPYYILGNDPLIDENNTMLIYRGRTVNLQFDYNSFDAPERVTFQWFDSFDRLVSTSSIFALNTNNIEGSDDSFYCVVTDTYGSDTTDIISISVVDSTNPYILKNIIKNGSGNDGTAEWETIGEMPEESGKFLKKWMTTSDPFTAVDGGNGTYYYHKFTSSIDDSVSNKNQWYPRPELFDAENGFAGDVANEIKNTYLRAGVFVPLNNKKENDYGGLTKSSTQVIDLTELANEIDGRVYGLKGLRAILFGWMGTRADQADYSTCSYEFLDENDIIIPVLGTPSISSCTRNDRVVNLYPTNPGAPSIDSKLLGGYYDTASKFDYSGIIYDGNASVVYDRYAVDYPDTDGNIVNGGPEEKTCILGRTSDPIIVPVGTRKIRVTKTYTHDGGLYDLYWNGSEFVNNGFDYISDCMMVGLNLRLYPILIDDSGKETDTSFDSNGNSVIKGMDFLETIPGPDEKSLLAQQALAGQTFTTYVEGNEVHFLELSYMGVAGEDSWFNMDINSALSETNPKSYLDILHTPGMNSFIGTDWDAYCNDALKDFINTEMPYPSQRALYNFRTNSQGIPGMGRGYPILLEEGLPKIPWTTPVTSTAGVYRVFGITENNDVIIPLTYTY